MCTRFDTMLEPVHTAVKQKSKGWVQCVGPLSRLSDYEYRWSGEYSDSQGDDLKELGTCGALFFPASGRLTRRRPPHIAFPESTLAGSSRGKMTLPDEFCVCDARADLCPSCLPNRKACELCSESFCRHCAPVHRRKCKEAHRDTCRVCRLDVGQSELHRCATDFGYGLRCATLACASCLERCDGEVFEARITAESFQLPLDADDGRCTRRICQVCKRVRGALCQDCADFGAQMWNPERVRRKRAREEAREMEFQAHLSLVNGNFCYSKHDFPEVERQLAAWRRVQPAWWHAAMKEDTETD